MIFLKIFVCSFVTVCIIVAIVWFALLVIDALDGINNKLIIIIKLLRKDQGNIPEVKSNEKDNEGSDSGSQDNDGNSIAY